MNESEWKKFKKLKEKCLQKYCNTVLDEANAIYSLSSKSSHEKYIDLYRLMRERDKELGRAFNGLSRSSAQGQLFMMYQMGLVEEHELDVFEPETKDHIRNAVKVLES